ncbi:MAG TPA: hypothetical protein VMB47_18300, partial [Candidatus Aquilonibacter sp.]|nr:hypothetical protein [Candidatus Aquilonibacter sp.]
GAKLKAGEVSRRVLGKDEVMGLVLCVAGKTRSHECLVGRLAVCIEVAETQPPDWRAARTEATEP